MSWFETEDGFEYVNEQECESFCAVSDDKAEEILRDNGYTVMRVVGRPGKLYVR